MHSTRWLSWGLLETRWKKRFFEGPVAYQYFRPRQKQCSSFLPALYDWSVALFHFSDQSCGCFGANVVRSWGVLGCKDVVRFVAGEMVFPSCGHDYLTFLIFHNWHRSALCYAVQFNCSAVSFNVYGGTASASSSNINFWLPNCPRFGSFLVYVSITEVYVPWGEDGAVGIDSTIVEDSSVESATVNPRIVCYHNLFSCGVGDGTWVH